MTYIKVIGFDWGGVLNDYTKHTEGMAQRLGIPVGDFEKIVAKHVRNFHLGLPEMEFWRIVCSEARVEAPTEPIWLETFEQTVKINEELFEVVRSLRNNGYKTVMVSNAELPNKEFIDRHIKGTPYDVFDRYVLSCEIGAVKPDREYWARTCGLLGNTPDHLLVVDDVLRNVQGAVAFGSRAIHHVTNQQTVKELIVNDISF